MDEKRTDLGPVEVVTKGARDAVYLKAPKRALAFVVWCREPRKGTVRISPKLADFTDGVWRAAFETYILWKRHQTAEFRLGDYHGHLRGGRQHPWTRTMHRRARRQAEDPLQQIMHEMDADETARDLGADDGTGIDEPPQETI